MFYYKNSNLRLFDFCRHLLILNQFYLYCLLVLSTDLLVKWSFLIFIFICVKYIINNFYFFPFLIFYMQCIIYIFVVCIFFFFPKCIIYNYILLIMDSIMFQNTWNFSNFILLMIYLMLIIHILLHSNLYLKIYFRKSYTD